MILLKAKVLKNKWKYGNFKPSKCKCVNQITTCVKMVAKATVGVYTIQQARNRIKKLKKIVQVNAMNLWRMNLVILKNRHRKLHQTIIVMTGMMRITKIKSKTLMMKSQTLIKSFMIGGKKNKNLRINKKAGSQSKKMTQQKKN